MNKPEVTRSKEMPKKFTREELARQVKKLRDRDSEMVEGIFKNLENPATGASRGAVSFGYKAYPGEEYTFYELIDGERYRIPRGVARHLNNNCYYKQYQPLSGDFGKAGIQAGVNPDGRLNTKEYQIAKKVHRYQFVSLEFMDDDADMHPSKLVEVTTNAQ